MIVKRYIDSLVDSLFKDGMNIINRAKATKEAQNDKYNMEDAFGCAVYYKGKIVKKGYANPTPLSDTIHKGWEKKGIEANTGRGYLDDFFSSYKPHGMGMELVCVNAVYYSAILEDGRQPNAKAKYRIISQTDFMFDSLKNKYKGSRVINLRK